MGTMKISWRIYRTRADRERNIPHSPNIGPALTVYTNYFGKIYLSSLFKAERILCYGFEYWILS